MIYRISYFKGFNDESIVEMFFEENNGICCYKIILGYN